MKEGSDRSCMVDVRRHERTYRASGRAGRRTHAATSLAHSLTHSPYPPSEGQLKSIGVLNLFDGKIEQLASEPRFEKKKKLIFLELLVFGSAKHVVDFELVKASSVS